MRLHLGLALFGYALDVELAPDRHLDDHGDELAHDSTLDSLVERAHPDDVAATAELDARSPARIGF